MRLVLLVCLLAVFGAGSSCADDWPHWRGPQRNDIVAESSGWNGKSWIDGKPLWSAGTGYGSSSPLVVGDNVYGFGWFDGKDILSCLDAATGKKRWQQTYTSPKYGRHHEGDEGFYAGPSATPEYDPETGWLFTLSLDGELAAWNVREEGQPIWRRNLCDDYKIEKRPRVGRQGRRDYGYTTSPLVSGELLLVEVGSIDHGSVIAFEKTTGKERWRSQAKRWAGHSGGLTPVEVEGIPCVGVLALTHFIVLRLDAGHAGETLGEIDWITAFGNNIPTPAVDKDRIVITSSAGGMSHMCGMKVSHHGLEKLWEKEIGAPVCSPVIRDGRFYWIFEHLTCSDVETGDTIWQSPALDAHDASLILTRDDRLIAFFKKGHLALAETSKRSPDKYAELAKQGPLFETDVWPHVVLASGRLLCKDREGKLKCFDLPK